MGAVRRYVLDVQPRVLDIKFQRGDSFGEQWEIDVPDYSGQGGPQTLDEFDPSVHSGPVEVNAQIRPKQDSTEILAVFYVIVLDPATRTVKPYLFPEDTELIQKNAFWDIEVVQPKINGRNFHRTFIQGKVIVGKDVTRIA